MEFAFMFNVAIYYIQFQFWYGRLCSTINMSLLCVQHISSQMELKLCLFCVALAILQTCSAETIDVILPAVSPHFFQYTLDIDPRDRDYNCIDANNTNNNNNNNNTATFWRHISETELTNPLNIYSAYETHKLSGINQFKCLTAGDTYLGSVLVNIQEGGHVIVSIDGIPTTYSSNQEVDVSEQTQNVALTCSAETGEWQLPSGAVSPSYPVLTLPLVTSQDNNTVYTCKRIIGGDTLLEISVTLAVQLMAVVSSPSPIATGTMQSSSSISLSTSIPTFSQELTPPSSSILAAVIPSSSLPAFQIPASSSVAFQSSSPVSTAVPASSSSSSSTTTTTQTTTQTTQTTTTTLVPIGIPLSPGVYAIPAALALIAALLLVVGLLCLLSCCLLPCVLGRGRLKKLDTEYYSERGSRDSLGGKYAPLSTLPPYVSLEETVFSAKIALSDFKERVNELWEKECDQLTDEYNSLGGSEMRYPAEHSGSDAVLGKNRYLNIRPYDRSRVVLGGDPSVAGSDYINASHIPGILVAQRFITTQGPKENTVQDFWQMVWENRIRHVVMVTRVRERDKKKSEQYWPDKVGDGVQMGPFHVTLVNLAEEPMWVCREMMVRREGEKRQKVKHYQFIGWPDFEAPRYPQDLILFMRKVKSEVGADTSTICVHCSAGVGRSGTFIALYNLMASIESGADISIFNVVNDMREYRPQMVQSLPQYKFLYLSVLELIPGDTSLHMNTFCHFYENRMQPDNTVYQTQFSEFEYQSDKSFTRKIERALDTNAINPDTMVLPFDDSRVKLSAPYWAGTDYINASHVETFRGQTQFIATQLPVSDSVRDLMQLMFQTRSPLLVLLSRSADLDEMAYDEGRIRYWPDPMTQHEFDGYTLMNENQLRHPLNNKLRLENVAQQKSHEFDLVTLLDWTASGEFDVSPASMQRLLQVTAEIDRLLAEAPDRPIVVHCKDGSGATGVFMAVYNAICRIREEQSVDIFQTAKRLRACRQYMVSSLEQYISVHTIINSYLQGMTDEDVPPVSVPPVTVPPVSVSPVTVPPVSVSPVTVPPVSVSPVTVSPVSVPPITVTPVSSSPTAPYLSSL